jgi:hypothetical protein
MGYKTSDELERSLNIFLDEIVEGQNLKVKKTAPTPVKFAQLIRRLHEETGEGVVILVDEYDKPLIDNLSKEEVYPKVKEALHSFYQVIKANVKYERFVFLTGVSQFSGLSIFSGLNNLIDITMSEENADICGYTQEEVESNFKEYIEEAAKTNKMTVKEILSEIKRWYNGYSWDGKTFVYNPFSTLLFFDNKKFNEYWFETGTPTFLIEQIRKRDDLETLIGPKEVSLRSLRGSKDTRIENMALLFQTGYSTIKKEGIVEGEAEYTIDFPNMEVRRAFIGDLLEVCTDKETYEVENINKRLGRGLKERDGESLRRSLEELFANIPYDLTTERESYYHSLFLLAGRLSGYEVEGEVHTDKGRIDAVLKRGKDVIVVEIKYGEGKKVEGLLKEGMKQIKEMKYCEKYGSNKVSLLVVAFGKNKEIGCEFK